MKGYALISNFYNKNQTIPICRKYDTNLAAIKLNLVHVSKMQYI